MARHRITRNRTNESDSAITGLYTSISSRNEELMAGRRSWKMNWQRLEYFVLHSLHNEVLSQRGFTFNSDLVLVVGVTSGIDIIFFVDYDLYKHNWCLDYWQHTEQDLLQKLKVEEV